MGKMNRDVLIIVFAVALVLMIYVIRYIIGWVVDKGADAVENKIRQVHSEKHPAENQSLADRLGVHPQTPPAVQSNQTPPPQPQSGNLADRFQTSAPSQPTATQAGTFCAECGAAVKPGSAFCAKCGAAVNRD